MTTNKQIEELLKKMRTSIKELVDYTQGFETNKDALKILNEQDEILKRIIKQTQKDTLDKVREMIGKDLDYRGNSPEVYVNAFKKEQRLKLNKLEKELI